MKTQTMTVEEFRRAELLAMSEDQFQRKVIARSIELGWEVAHFRASRTAHGWRTACQGTAKGFPDLILLRHGIQVIAEIKAEGGKITPEQRRWLGAFSKVPGAIVCVWRPSDWQHIEEVLTDA